MNDKKKFSLNIYNLFKKLKLNQNKNLFVTSNLQKLAKIRILKSEKLEIILNNLKKILGKNYSIFTPTATLNLCNTDIIFDLFNSPAHRMGPLAEYIRQKDSTRSIHPYWSVSGIGQYKNLLKNVSKHAYGHKSPWSIMTDLDFTQLNIGMHPSKAVTLIHHIETIMGVPYRFNKEFEHKIKINNKIYSDKFYLSVFYKSTIIKKKQKLNEHFFNEMKKQKKLNYALDKKSGLEMWSFRMNDFFEIATKMIQNNMYSYLEETPDLSKVHNQ